MKIYVLLILFVGILRICIGRQTDTNRYEYDKSKSLMDSINVWKSDTFGCNWVRSLSTAEYMLERIDIIGLNKDSIISIFGTPNRFIVKESYTGLFYCTKSICLNEQDSLHIEDCCFLLISLDKMNKVSEAQTSCI